MLCAHNEEFNHWGNCVDHSFFFSWIYILMVNVVQLFWLRYNITCGWHRAEGVPRDFNIVIDGRHNSMFRQIIPSVTSKLFFRSSKSLGKNINVRKLYLNLL